MSRDAPVRDRFEHITALTVTEDRWETFLNGETLVQPEAQHKTQGEPQPMKPPTAIALSALLIFLAASASVFAHHGFAAYTNDRVTVQATLTEFRFVNPHVQLYFDIENEAGRVEHWQGEMTSPNKLARAGWTKNTLKPGEHLQISGEVARNGGHSIRVREVVTASGESLPVFENVLE
jgi:hypothetical protein